MTRYAQSTKSLNTAQKIKSRYKVLERNMHRKHMEWMETLHAIHGDQYRVIQNGRLVDLSQLSQDDPSSFRVTHNYLFQTFRSMIAVALQNEPQPVVSLVRPGKDSRAMSRAIERLLKYFYIDKEYEESLKAALGWTFTCGTGFMGAMWDSEGADPEWVQDVDSNGNLKYETRKEIMTDEDGNMSFSEYGTPLTEEVLVPKGSYKKMGDVRFIAPSPFDVFPEGGPNWSQVKAVTIRQFEEKQTLVDVYGEKAKTLVADANSSDFVRYDELQSNSIVDVLLLQTSRFCTRKISPAENSRSTPFMTWNTPHPCGENLRFVRPSRFSGTLIARKQICGCREECMHSRVSWLNRTLSWMAPLGCQTNRALS